MNSNLSPSLPSVRPISAVHVRNMIATLDTDLDLQGLADDTRFVDAGADSLDFFNIIAGVQDASGVVVPDCDIEQVTTIQGLVSYLNTRLP